jgi:hypothetical protein
MTAMRKLLPAMTAIALLPGCGAGDRERDARDSVERFFAAIEARDGRAACDELSRGAAAELEKSEQKPCETAVMQLGLAAAEVSGAEVYLVSARVELASGGSAFLDETSAGWKITAVGCEPRPGRPYDCELEA